MELQILKHILNELKSSHNGFDKIYDNKISSGLLNWEEAKIDPKTLNLSLNINNLDDYYSKISKNISISQVVNKNSQNIYTNQEKIARNKLVEEISESIIGNSLEIIKKIQF